jgi:diguanylate cyclase (GGDEF)-like protein
MRIDRIYEIHEHNQPFFWTIAGLVCVGLLGLTDYLTGNQILFSFFYLIPIVLATWLVDQNLGLLMSLVSALTWLVAEAAPELGHDAQIIYSWNTLIHAGFFVLVTHLTAELQKSRREEVLAARTDFTTGVANARYFSELLNTEVERIHRYPQPFTVVYIDIDNFKLVNDLFGHKIGDEVLHCIAGELKAQLRSSDAIARVGGDEFAILLPSTGQPEAQVVISKVHANLTEAMRRRSWPVTFSMGAVTYVCPPYSVEELIDTADRLMYEVKNTTKNGIRFDVWTGECPRRQEAFLEV